ncbi:MAG: ComEC/Rec2 family competence protein [Phycisphaerales bacterium]|nr:ComEC/Rec2 family competence protein [Phycisphaerales bacterium]
MDGAGTSQFDSERSGAALRAWTALGCFALGVVLWRWIGSAYGGAPAAAWFALACCALVFSGLSRGVACKFALCLAVVVCGAGWATLRIDEHPSRLGALHLRVADPATDRRLIELEGVAMETPSPIGERRGAMAGFLRFGGEGERFSLRIESLRGDDGGRDSSGVVRVFVGESLEGRVRAGDRVRLAGRFRPPEPPLNPGQRDSRPLLAQRGEIGSVDVPLAGLVEVLPEERGVSGRAARVIEAMRARAGAVFAGEDEPHDGATMMQALILGETEADDAPLRGVFIRVGVAHLLAISGFHLAVMAGATLWFVRLTGDRGRLEPLLVAVLVLAYLVIVPAKTPIVRAGAMVLILLLAESTGRRYDRLALLGWIAVGLLVWRPLDVFALGWQLSVGLTALLLWAGPRVDLMLRGPTVDGRPIRGLIDDRPSGAGLVLRRALTGVVLAFACWVFSAPAVLAQTGVFSPLSAPATVLATPLVVVSLWAGYVALGVGVVLPEVGRAMAGPVAAFAGEIAAFVSWIDRLPGASMRGADAPAWWAALTTAALCVTVGARRRWMRRAAIGVTLGLCVWLAGERWRGGELGSDVVLRLDTIAVGDGSCHLIRSGESAILFDCGSTWPGVGTRRIPDALRALGVRRIDAAYVTHPDFDHYSGLIDVSSQLEIGALVVERQTIVAAEQRPWGPERALLDHFRSVGVPIREVRSGDTTRIGRATMRVLWPGEGSGGLSSNDASIVGLIEVPTDGGVRTMLMTADAMGRAIEGMVAEAERLVGDRGLDVMELPHHGSFVPQAAAMIERLNPKVIVQSSGPRRLRELRWLGVREGREWPVTARDGAVSVEVLRDGSVRMKTWRGD